MTLPSFAANLDGLMSLATRSGVDVRPTLLRTLTDLYVQKSVHSLDEEQQYTELALRLIDGVDVATRTAVAERLAVYPRAPVAIMGQLARDVLSVAFPILRLSTVLDQDELDSIALQCGSAHAAVIATRRAAKPAATNAPQPDVSGEQTEAAAPVPACAPEPAPPLVPAQSPRELCEVFFAADPDERRLILINLDFAATPQPLRSSPSVATATLARLEQAVMAGQLDVLADQLARLLDLPPMMALQVARDRSGEALLVAGKALGMPASMYQRIVMFLDPAIGHSVQRVFALADLYDEVSWRAAEEMVAIWRGRPNHRPVPSRTSAREARPQVTPRPWLQAQPITSSMK